MEGVERFGKPISKEVQVDAGAVAAVQQGQDIAEYAVMLALILVLVVGTIRLVGSNANNAFSSAASSIQ
jgi:Flp pilus assembly pilin Flp